MNRLLVIAVTLLGFGSSALGVRSSWFDVPIGFTASPAGEQVVRMEPWSTPIYKAVAVCVLTYAAAVWIAGGRWRRTLSLVLPAWMALLLLFPWTVMMLDDEVAGRAAWLQAQHENLTWLGGDLATSQEQATQNWKHRLYIVDVPTSVSIAPPPADDAWLTGLDSMPKLVEWLGYSNTFCQFARRSWMLVVFGTVCLLATHCFSRGKAVLSRMRCAMIRCAVVFGLGSAMAWGIQWYAWVSVRHANECTRQGQYLQAGQHLQQAAHLLPTLRHDSDYVTQCGLLDHLAGRPTPNRQLFRAFLLESEGRYAEAEQVYLELLTAASRGHIDVTTGRVACQGLMRSAVNALNSGDDSQAIRQLREVLRFHPCDLKANYVLQLAYLRRGDHGALPALADRMHTTYACFKFPNKRVVLAAAYQNTSYAAYQQGNVVEAWQYSTNARHP